MRHIIGRDAVTLYYWKVDMRAIGSTNQANIWCAAGALGRLQRLVDGQPGNQWADPDKALGRFLYSTYTEADYNVIWKNYMYISQDNWWVEYDFGKKNCSEAGPRRADIPARLEDVWVDQVGNLVAPHLQSDAVSRTYTVLLTVSTSVR